MTKPRYLIYLHGFNSSPQSLKAQQTHDFVNKNRPQINLVIPELAVSAHDALSQIKQ
ncbi:MAG: YqiA/YcfP family alpha/beta fold hydrolase, partial [Psychrobium sp.]